MTITVRLEKKLEKALKLRAARTGKSLSVLMREALTEKLAHSSGGHGNATPYDSWVGLGVTYKSRKMGRSEQVKELVTQGVQKEHRRQTGTRRK